MLVRSVAITFKDALEDRVRLLDGERLDEVVRGRLEARTGGGGRDTEVAKWLYDRPGALGGAIRTIAATVYKQKSNAVSGSIRQIVNH